MGEKIETIFIDVDGCLLPTNGDVSPEYYSGLYHLSQYIQKANQKKFPAIGFCTGRDRNYVEAVSFFTGLPNSWSVIESGIALFNPTTKELIFNSVLTPEIRAVFKEITAERVPKILGIYPELFLYPGNMVCVAIERRHGVTITIEECYEKIRKEMSDLLQRGLIRIAHSDCAIDISPSDIDKASGIRFFLALQTGINLSQILGIGDSRGDFPLLELVGYVGCPANASKECKELVIAKGGYISQFRYVTGVADIISHFIKEG